MTWPETQYTASVTDQLHWELLEVPRAEFAANYKKLPVADWAGTERKVVVRKTADVAAFTANLRAAFAVTEPGELLLYRIDRKKRIDMVRPALHSNLLFLPSSALSLNHRQIFKPSDPVSAIESPGAFLDQSSLAFVLLPPLPPDADHLLLRVVFFNTAFEYSVQLHHRPLPFHLCRSDQTLGALLARLAPYLPREEADAKYAFISAESEKLRLVQLIEPAFPIWDHFQQNNPGPSCC